MKTIKCVDDKGTIKFVNYKGEELKTTISDEIMNKISDLIEQELKDKNIFYLRNGTNFSVPSSKIDCLLEAQLNANKKLISQGIITKDMLLNDIKNNF